MEIDWNKMQETTEKAAKRMTDLELIEQTEKHIAYEQERLQRLRSSYEYNQTAKGIIKEAEQAKRDPFEYAYNCLHPKMIEYMARIGGYGALKYGYFNWQKSRMDKDKDPINHALHHINLYRQKADYDHPEVGLPYWIHLAAAAFNLNMEIFYALEMDQPKAILSGVIGSNSPDRRHAMSGDLLKGLPKHLTEEI